MLTSSVKSPAPNATRLTLVPAARIASIRLAIRAKCQMKQLLPEPSAVPEPRLGFEQKSAAKWLGLPLYHLRLGTRPTRRAPAVKAWIAISDGIAMGGLFAFGPCAMAPVSMGVVSLGLLTVGIFAFGGGALGIVAAGWLTTGLVAIGGMAAKGVVAVAPLTAAHGKFAAAAGAEAAKAFFQTHWFYRFTAVVTQGMIWAGLLGWVMPVVLTGWQLWRTRRDPV